MKKYSIILILFLFLLPVLVSASNIDDNKRDICGLDFDIPEMNGRYRSKGILASNAYYLEDDGQFNYWQNGNYILYAVGGTTEHIPFQWWIGEKDSLGTSLAYVSAYGVFFPQVLGSWTPNGRTVKCEPSFSAVVGEADNDFSSSTGFSLGDLVTWAGGNFILVGVGIGLALFNEIKYWILALVIISLILAFVSIGLQNKGKL